MSQISTPSIDRLKKAVEIAEQIEKLQSDLASVLGGQPASASAAAPTAKAVKVASQPVKGKGKRTMSPEARERIAAAQRARWAKSRGAAAAKPAAVSSPAKAKGRRTLSPEAREKIAAAARRRWAAVKKK